SAVGSGVKEVRETIAESRGTRRRGGRTGFFFCEIHPFKKGQPDAPLPAVEEGTLTPLGATTENPPFGVDAAILSRCRVVTRVPSSEQDIQTILRRALADTERGLAAERPLVSEADLDRLSRVAEGDARVALSALESAVRAAEPDREGQRMVTWPLVVES